MPKKHPRSVGNAGAALSKALSPRELHVLMTALNEYEAQRARQSAIGSTPGWRKTEAGQRRQGEGRQLRATTARQSSLCFSQA